MDRMFAKPFVGAIEGHQDGVYCLARDPRRVGVIAGGGGDGEVIVHSLPLRRPLLKLPQAHKGMVSGVTFTAHESDKKRNLLSCSAYDMTIKLWKTSQIAGHLSHVVEDDGENAEDGVGGFEGNAFKAKDETQLGSGMLDDDHARLDGGGLDLDDDGFLEEEGGGLNIVDQAKRDAAAAKMEPLMTWNGKFGFKYVEHS